MRYFEYKSPDDRVLLNEDTLSYGSTIMSKRYLNLYLIDKNLAEAIRQYNDIEDKSQMSMFQDTEGTYVDFANIKDYLQQNYICNTEEIIITEHNT